MACAVLATVFLVIIGTTQEVNMLEFLMVLMKYRVAANLHAHDQDPALFWS